MQPAATPRTCWPISPEAWEAIRPRMNAKSDAQFEQLKFDWIAGIPDRKPC